MALIQLLDAAFQLGGRLVTMAVQEKPVLALEPLPDVAGMDKAREDAVARVREPQVVGTTLSGGVVVSSR